MPEQEASVGSVVNIDEAFRNTPVLVTGGAGFIGSAVCARLQGVGAQVHSVSRRAEGPPVALRHWRLDLTDEKAVAGLVNDVKPAYVFHLASHVMGAPGLEHVMPAFHSNLQTSVNLMYALATVGCKRIVLTGSLVEPDPNVAQKIPNSPYAAAKWAASDYARMFHALYGLPTAIARVFMVYGPGQQDETKLVPYAIRCIQRGEAPKISSGTHLIDWIYVDDVVDGLLMLAASANVDGKTADLGSGNVISTANFTEKLCELTQAGIRPVIGAIPDRPLEPKRVAHVDETKKLIGWAPRVELSDGLKRTIDWYGKHPKRPS
jgi:nucleoside-diphosphate-sugar epimerase